MNKEGKCMNCVIRGVVICFFSCFLCQETVYASVRFDDFSGSQIDNQKWHSQFWNDKGIETVREVKENTLQSTLRVSTENTGDYANRAVFQNANAIQAIQATTEISGYDFASDVPDAAGQTISSTLEGYFYRDSNGDVYAGVALVDFNDGNGLVAGCQVIDGQGNMSSQMFTSVDVNLDAPYALSLQYDNANSRFVCGIDDLSGHTQEVTIARPTNDSGDPQVPFKALSTYYTLHGVSDGAFYADAFINATFDDVKVNGSAYDDFASAPLDASKWYSGEIVREIRDNALQMNVQNQGISKESNDLYLAADSITDYFQADLTIESSSEITGDNTRGQARIYGAWYNSMYDGAGYNGGEGDVFAGVYVDLTADRSFHIYANAWKCADQDCEATEGVFSQDFSCSVEFDTPVTISVERTKDSLVFGCNHERITYTVNGLMAEPVNASRKLRARVYSAPGENGYIKAQFDNVFLVHSFPWNLFIPSLHGQNR